MPIFNFLNVKDKKAVKIEAENFKEAEAKYDQSRGKTVQKIRKPRKHKAEAPVVEAVTAETPATS